MHICCFLLAIFSLSIHANGQIQRQLWTRFTLTQPINTRWSIALELQHRRISRPYDNGYLPLQHQLLNSARTWVNYRINRWTFILSPVAYFDYTLYNAAVSRDIRSREWRSMAGAGYQADLQYFFNANRILYEISSIKSDNSETYIRHRYRFQSNIWIPFIRKTESFTALQLGDELFIRTINSATGFDQNRFFTGIRWQRKQNILLTGVQFTKQRSANSNVHLHQFLIAANVALPEMKSKQNPN